MPFHLRRTLFPSPNLQINVDNLVPQSRSAAQPPTVRPTAPLDIKVSTSPLLLGYISGPVRLKSLSQDSFKEDFVLICCHFCPEDCNETFLYLIYEAFFVENNSAQTPQNRVLIKNSTWNQLYHQVFISKYVQVCIDSFPELHSAIKFWCQGKLQSHPMTWYSFTLYLRRMWMTVT